MKSEKEGINMRQTKTILSVKEYSPLDVRGLCSLVVRTMLTGRKDYIRFQVSWNRIGEPYFCGRQSVLLRPSKRHFVSVETALCRRRNVLSSKPEKATPPITNGMLFHSIKLYFRDCCASLNGLRSKYIKRVESSTSVIVKNSKPFF